VVGLKKIGVHPKKKLDLTRFFDALDFKTDLDDVAENWAEMEKKLLDSSS
jgi:hypothetical protein